MKKAKGFTLVELVVVIAIIGILAAILIPSMLNYVRKARLKSANTNAKTAYNAVTEFITTVCSERRETQSQALSEYGGQTVDRYVPPSGSMNDAQRAVHDVLAENGIESGVVWVEERTVNANDAFYVQWTNQRSLTNVDSTIIVGQYPDPVSWATYKAGSMWKSYMTPVE